MGTQTEMAVDRRRRQVAASYRKQGYRVTAPSSPDALPAFLHDCHPDLIAEKPGDQVVIEVKPSRALKGANDLRELAQRVADEPGWRLELVALRTHEQDTSIREPGWLDRMLRPAAPGSDIAGHCVYLAEVLAVLIQAEARRARLKVKDKTPLRIARELGFAGMIDQDLLDRIESTYEWRNALMHGQPVPRTPADQAAEIEKLCRNLHAQAQNPED